MGKLSISIILAVLVLGSLYFSSSKPVFNFSSNHPVKEETMHPNQALASQFIYLSQNGNSSCSAAFTDSIPVMAEMKLIRGSCCGPMSIHRYGEQVEGLKKFKSQPDQNISKIPDDPYDIEAGLAKELMFYYDLKLTPKEQEVYDYAMLNSSENGPCCCKCWRWYVYGGLGKYLIKNYGFTGEQITELWNLSDGCGGDSEHHH